MQRSLILVLLNCVLMFGLFGCKKKEEKNPATVNRLEKSPEELLGNPKYLAMSYGGYRMNSRDQQPSIEQLKEDMKILNAMGVHVLRTYNTAEFPHCGQSCWKPFIS